MLSIENKNLMVSWSNSLLFKRFFSWWNMATHLCWSLLGLADLDKLNSVDNPFISLIYLLYSFFLITGVILLVNMMIALLSNTYQRVQVLNSLSTLAEVIYSVFIIQSSDGMKSNRQ